ncbi:hypothetical protein BT93_K1376 [Corymbia citriodora subsp. variegata]|nr:hypothetical protein BT93_K1376 [Corymbia citriodora subsp. variegata]
MKHKILELVTGQIAADCTLEENDERFHSLNQVKAQSLEFIVDPDLQGAYDKEEIDRVIQLAFLCKT